MMHTILTEVSFLPQQLDVEVVVGDLPVDGQTLIDITFPGLEPFNGYALLGLMNNVAPKPNEELFDMHADAIYTTSKFTPDTSFRNNHADVFGEGWKVVMREMRDVRRALPLPPLLAPFTLGHREHGTGLVPVMTLLLRDADGVTVLDLSKPNVV